MAAMILSLSIFWRRPCAHMNKPRQHHVWPTIWSAWCIHINRVILQCYRFPLSIRIRNQR